MYDSVYYIYGHRQRERVHSGFVSKVMLSNSCIHSNVGGIIRIRDYINPTVKVVSSPKLVHQQGKPLRSRYCKVRIIRAGKTDRYGISKQ